MSVSLSYKSAMLSDRFKVKIKLISVHCVQLYSFKILQTQYNKPDCAYWTAARCKHWTSPLFQMSASVAHLFHELSEVTQVAIICSNHVTLSS